MLIVDNFENTKREILEKKKSNKYVIILTKEM